MIKKSLLILGIGCSLFAEQLVIGQNSLKNLNIYNNNIAFMQEYENVKLNKSIDTIIYKNIPSSIITDSVNIKNDSLNILTQQYFYNTPTQYNILKANINKEVIYFLDTKSYELKKGKLLSITNNNSLIKDNQNNFIYFIPNNQIQIEKLPSNMYINPFLKWNLSSMNSIQDNNIQLSYLLKNMTWNSEYNAYLDTKNKKMKLSGWFNIKNNSGIDFKKINLNIIAGKINNIDNQNHRYNYRLKRSMVMANISSLSNKNIKAKSTSGLKTYKIPFKVDLNNKQNTQINFINDEFDYKMVNKFNLRYNNGIKNLKAKQFLNFENTTNKPLPSGNIRFYTTTFLGSNKLVDLSPKMKSSLYINDNFDLFLNNNILTQKTYKNVFKNGENCRRLYNIVSKTKIVNNNNNTEEIEINLNINNNNYTNIIVDNSNVQIDKNENNQIILKMNVNKKSKIVFQTKITICKI